MSSDMLSTVNDCLLMKGQNVVAVADDGSPEWNVCAAAYRRGTAHLTHEHNWNFATDIATLTRTGDSPDPAYDDQYALPNGCLHAVWVRLDDEPVAYAIVGNRVLLSAGDGVVTCRFLAEPGPEQWPPMFVSALSEWVFAGIESGLKRDQAEADRHLAKADIFLQRARTRTDQQEPKRTLFVSRHAAARRTRRG